MSLDPLVRESLPALIARDLRAAVIEGRLTSGERFNEARLAEQLGTSRGMVREALQRLVQEGLAVSQPRRGVFVRVLTAEDVADVHLARQAVEATAIVHAARAGDEKLPAELGRVVDRMVSAGRRRRWRELAELDLLFHETLVQSAGSERLSRMFDTLLAEMRLCLNALQPSYPQPLDVAQEHQHLLDAIIAQDPDRAHTLLIEHLQQASRALTTEYSAPFGQSG